MESATANSNGPFSQTLPASPSVLFSAIMFSSYLASIAGFLVLVISGLVLIHAQYALQAIADEHQPPSPSNKRNHCIQPGTDAERAFNQQDLEATAVMKRARAFALFGPLPTIPTLVAIPVSLHDVGDVSVRVMLSALLITIIHCANACTIQTYFSLIQKETIVTFGPEICSARHEKTRSRYLMKVYLTVLLFVSFLSEANAKNMHFGALEGWEAATTYGGTDENSPFTLARLSEDFSDTNGVDSMELRRLV